MELQARWIRCAEKHPNMYWYARRRFEVTDPPLEARLRITADTSYRVWVNGVEVGRGPGPYVRSVRSVDEYDVTTLLRDRENVICVLGHWWGVTSHSRPKGDAGILAELSWEDASGAQHVTGTDERWVAVHSQAWAEEVPRRSGAIAWTEYYDARQAPESWTLPGFDDSDWPAATVVDPGERVLEPRMRPLLREGYVGPVKLAGAWTAPEPAPTLGGESELTQFLDEEPLEPLPDERAARIEHALVADAPVTIEAGDPVALTLDLGEEIVGHLELDVDAPGGVRIDLCPAELLRHGRPWCLRKGCRYAQQYITREGRQRWQTFYWHGLRYLHVVIRDLDKPLTIHRCGVRRREADLPPARELSVGPSERFDAGMIERIWEVSRHTIEVGTQEVQVDCPTREQAAYWGDAIWIGLWTLWLTGDASHMKHLLLSAEEAQYEDGQLPASIFSSLDQILFDYTLIMPWGLYAYWWHTGDLLVPTHLDATVERLLDWYRDRLGDSGLVELDAIAAHEAGEGTLFIDHPGLGWHNFPHPGLDRRGLSAGLNLFMLRALQCWSRLLAEIGHADRSEATASEAQGLSEAIEHTFFDAQRGVYADALVDGRLSDRVSQQINTLAILTGVCPAHRRRDVLEHVLSDDPDLCRCSPYFWLYQFDAMAMAGMHEEMLRAIIDLWGAMVEAGATTWWETFLGDELDSLCHPWSSAPCHALQKHFLGVQCAGPGFAQARIAPRMDLLPEMAGSVCTVRGEIEVRWSRSGEGRVELFVRVPAGCAATIVAPEGWRMAGDTEAVTLAGGTALHVEVCAG